MKLGYSLRDGGPGDGEQGGVLFHEGDERQMLAQVEAVLAEGLEGPEESVPVVGVQFDETVEGVRRVIALKDLGELLSLRDAFRREAIVVERKVVDSGLVVPGDVLDEAHGPVGAGVFLFGVPAPVSFPEAESAGADNHELLLGGGGGAGWVPEGCEHLLIGGHGVEGHLSVSP